MTTDNSGQESASEGATKEPPPQPPPPPTTTETPATIVETSTSDDEGDNGILEFMPMDTAIELYKRLAKEGLPKLDFKFYGRRKPNEPNDSENQCDKPEGSASKEQQGSDEDKSILDNTEFDFDESFSELQAETSAISDSLQLKKRFEPGSERKTNLSDIMSDILKETTHEPE